MSVDKTVRQSVAVADPYYPTHVLRPNADGSLSVVLGAPSSYGDTPALKSALTNAAQTVKSTPGTLTGYYIYNPVAAVSYVQVYDTAGAVVVGTTVPVLSFGIPAQSGANLSTQVGFSNAIKVAATDTPTGANAPASALVANFWYR